MVVDVIFCVFLLVCVVPLLLHMFPLSFGLLDPPHWRPYMRKHIPVSSASSRPSPTSTTSVLSCRTVSVSDWVKGMRNCILMSLFTVKAQYPKADNQRFCDLEQGT